MVFLMIPAIRQEKILDMLSGNEIIATDDIMKGLDISVSIFWERGSVFVLTGKD